MAREYPEEVKEFIKSNVKGRRVKDLVKLVNEKFGTKFTETKMRSFMKNHGLRNEMPTGLRKGEVTSKYPQEIRDFIHANYKGIGPTEMVRLLNEKFGTNYTVNQIRGYYRRNNLNSGLTGHFPKGNKPWNKGMKGLNLGGKETQFKNGHIPANHQPVGSERICSRDGYVLVKVAEPNRWVPKHRLIWEKANGPVPDGHVVIFGDGNKRNFDIDNLILVSRKQLLGLNKEGLIQNDADLTRTAIKIVDLEWKILERKKELS